MFDQKHILNITITSIQFNIIKPVAPVSPVERHSCPQVVERLEGNDLVESTRFDRKPGEEKTFRLGDEKVEEGIVCQHVFEKYKLNIKQLFLDNTYIAINAVQY